MNQRILELMRQADYPAPEMAPRAQKLVELVVRECADYISETATIETLLGERLREQFGVEE